MKRFALLLGVLLCLAAGSALAAQKPTATPAPTVRDLAVGDYGQDVRALQTQLTKLGYYDGTVSGHYGEATASSVRDFQMDFSLSVTGEADVRTQQALLTADYRPVRFGSSGGDIKRIQKRLANLGYYTGKVSGNFLSATEDAIKAFQKKMGLYVTGEADIETQRLLFSDKARSRTESTSVTPAPAVTEPVVNADPGAADLEIEEILLDEENADSSAETETTDTKFKKKLQYESRGGQVKQLQQRLTDLGYYTGPVSGNYLGHTRNAVKAFQKQNGLDVDGVVGEGTWDAIFNDPYVILPDQTPRPSPTPEPVAFHMVVDVTNQIVSVYARDENNEYTELIREMMCSSGTRKNPSDVGDWVLKGRKARWCFFPTWGDYAQYWTQINSSIAFHSLIYMETNTMSLSQKSYKRLGNRASHGCVRLQVSDAKWVYDNIGAGTVVTITESLPADPELKASIKKPKLNTKNMLPYPTPMPTMEPVYVSGAMPPLPIKKLQKNDESEAVFWLQKKLTELGYYKGKCSGTYLAGTQAAVKAYQKDHGLKATGTADETTLKKIYASELAEPKPGKSRAPSVTRTPAVPGVTPVPIPTPVPTPKPEIWDVKEEIPLTLPKEQERLNAG